MPLQHLVPISLSHCMYSMMLVIDYIGTEIDRRASLTWFHVSVGFSTNFEQMTALFPEQPLVNLSGSHFLPWRTAMAEAMKREMARVWNCILRMVVCDKVDEVFV